MQNAGYKTIHIGKFLNGYGDKPYDEGKTVPPGWSSWHTILNADTNHYYYGYLMNNNGTIEGPYGDSGSWETREYGARDDIGCPFAPTNGLPCYYETDHLTELATEEIAETPPEQPFYLQLDYTAPHGDFRRPAGPEPAPRHYDWFKGARLPHDRSEGFDEGNVTDKPRFIREAEHLTLNDKHTYRVYWQKQLESLRSVDDGVKLIIDTLGGVSRLRNTYILFTSDNGFFFGEHRLIGGKFLAYEPATHLPFLIRGPGIKPGTSTGELSSQIDIAPTVLELAGATADKSIDGRSMVPFLKDPSLRTRRPLLFESFVETSDVEQGGGAETPPAYEPAPNSGGSHRRPGAPAAAKAAPPPRSSPRPRTTRESASAPTSTSPGRPGRRSSTTSTKTRTSSTTWSRSPTTSRSATTSTRCSPAASKKKAGSRTASAAPAGNRRLKIPLNRIELRRVRKQEKEEKRQERREKKEQREQERKEKEQAARGKNGR